MRTRPAKEPSGIASGDITVVSEGGRASARLPSLDVFRGVTIAAMLVVNNPGNWDAIYSPLRHAEWHGWTVTDLVFPFFLFIVGVAMACSFDHALRTGILRKAVLAKAVRRSLLLIVIGLALQTIEAFGYNYSDVRLPGVLQRIGLTFLIATPLVLWVGWRGRAILVTGLLLLYWALLTVVPVPGVGAGILEPGRDLGAYIDRTVFGLNHLSADFRGTDPNGLLSTIPAAGTVLFGVFAGEWLRLERPLPPKVPAMLVGGLTVALAGLAWDPFFPINKALWTSSFAVFTAGLAATAFAIVHWLVDVRGFRRWMRPFEMLGVNAIAVYVLAALMTLALWKLPAPGPPLAYTWLYEQIFLPWFPPQAASAAFGVCYAALWAALMWGFHRKRVLITL